MVDLVWTEEARLWLKEIFEYIKIDNSAAAKRTIISIQKKSQIIRQHPKSGYRYEEEEFPNDEIRILLYGHYRIAYLYETDKAYILGVYHGALDLKRHLIVPLDLK